MNNYSIPQAEGWKENVLSHETYVLNTPTNKQDIPCDSGCPNRLKCKEQILECSAIRTWYWSGDYKPEEVGKLLRKAK